MELTTELQVSLDACEELGSNAPVWAQGLVLMWLEDLDVYCNFRMSRSRSSWSMSRSMSRLWSSSSSRSRSRSMSRSRSWSMSRSRSWSGARALLMSRSWSRSRSRSF